MADDFEDESGSLVDRIKESPRTVSALIIILIVAAAIYAFSGEPQDGLDLADNTAATDVTTDEESDEDAVVAEEIDAEGEMVTTDTPATTTAATPQPVSEEKLMEETKSLPEPTRTNEGYQEVAQAGDSVTKLARRAATRWLSENQAGYAVTNEHRIYIEDYIQNQLGSEGLALGEARTVSFDLIAQAVAAAGQLNDSQLRNLTQYTGVLN